MNTDLLSNAASSLHGLIMLTEEDAVRKTIAVATESIEASAPEGPNAAFNEEHPRKAFLLHAPTAGMYVVCGELGRVNGERIDTPVFIFPYHIDDSDTLTISRGAAYGEAVIFYNSLVNGIREATGTPEDMPVYRVWTEATDLQPMIDTDYSARNENANDAQGHDGAVSPSPRNPAV